MKKPRPGAAAFRRAGNPRSASSPSVQKPAGDKKPEDAGSERSANRPLEKDSFSVMAFRSLQFYQKPPDISIVFNTGDQPLWGRMSGLGLIVEVLLARSSTPSTTRFLRTSVRLRREESFSFSNASASADFFSLSETT